MGQERPQLTGVRQAGHGDANQAPGPLPASPFLAFLEHLRPSQRREPEAEERKGPAWGRMSTNVDRAAAEPRQMLSTLDSGQVTAGKESNGLPDFCHWVDTGLGRQLKDWSWTCQP